MAQIEPQDHHRELSEVEGSLNIVVPPPEEENGSGSGFGFFEIGQPLPTKYSSVKVMKLLPTNITSVKVFHS